MVYCLFLTGKDLLKLLKKHGFVLKRVSGSHHILDNGKIKVSVPVHGNRDLPVGLLNSILKQAGLK